MLRIALFHWKLEIGNWKFREGFTLIELLIVLALLGILTTAGATSYIATQKNARDARRKTDLETFRQTLELYKSTNSSYPDNPDGSYIYSTDGAVKTSLTTSVAGGPYINTTSYPKDPQTNLGIHYVYYRISSTQYILCTRLEGSNTGGVASCNGQFCGASRSDITTQCNYGLDQP